MRTFEEFTKIDGKKLQIYRNNNLITTTVGLVTGNHKFSLAHDCPIQIGDMILFVAANKKYTVDSIEPIPCFDEDAIDCLEVYCSNPRHSSTPKIVNYNVRNAYGSSFGESASSVWNGNSISIDEIIIKNGYDPKDFEELLQTIKAAMKNDECKKGFLEKFGDTLAKHSWLATPIAQQLISYFVGNK